MPKTGIYSLFIGGSKSLLQIQLGKLIRRFLDIDDSLFFSFLAFLEKISQENRLEAFG